MLKKAKCCICDKSLENNLFTNIVPLLRKANWQFPIMSNILINVPTQAVGVLCDDCMHTLDTEDKVRFAIELKDDVFIYHPVSELDQIGKRKCEKCEHDLPATFFNGDDTICYYCRLPY